MIKHLDKHFISLQLYGVNFNLVEWLADEKYNPPKDSLDEMFIRSISTLASNISRNLFYKAEGKITISVKNFLDNLKDRIPLAEIENIVEKQYKKYINALKIKPIDRKSNTPLRTYFLKTKHKELIVKKLARKINIKELDFESSKRLLMAKTVSKKVRNKAYKTRSNEPSPNHAHALDVLSATIKPHKWENIDNRLEYYCPHKNQNYIQLQLFRPDSTGDLIPIDHESALDITNNFDWKDRKILRLLMTEAVANNGKFSVSGRWILEKLGDNKRTKQGNRDNRQYKSIKEKLEDIEIRLERYKLITLKWRWNYNKKDLSLLPDGTPLYGKFSLFSIPNIYYSKHGNSTDLIAEIIPGYWFNLNQDNLKEFTWIPEKLLKIDTTKNWRLYAVGEYILINFRRNKKNLIKANPRKLTVRIDTLLDEVLPPDEIEYAMNTPYKGTKLKQGVISDTLELKNLFGWQFDWVYDGKGDSFDEFYNSASFTVVLDSELEALLFNDTSNQLPAKHKSTQWLDGEDIKALRKKLKLSQAAFASSLGYNRSYISKLETEKEPITNEFLTNLYRNFGNHL